MLGYDAEASLPTYDPEVARALLRQAGVVDGTEIVFEAPQGRYPKDDQIALAVRLPGANRSPGAASRPRMGGLPEEDPGRRWGTLFLLAGTKRSFDPHFTITRLYGNSGVFGRAYYGKPQIDALAAEAAAELDLERRSRLYGNILAMLRGDAPAVWIAQTRRPVRASSWRNVAAACR